MEAVAITHIPMSKALSVLKWLHKRRREFQENLVLSKFPNSDRDYGPWQSANGILGELYLKAAFRDKWGYLPIKNPTLRQRIRVIFYRVHHNITRLLLPTKEGVDEILRDLWKRNLLERADWNPNVYKLRTCKE